MGKTFSARKTYVNIGEEKGRVPFRKGRANQTKHTPTPKKKKPPPPPPKKNNKTPPPPRREEGCKQAVGERGKNA